MKYVTFNGKNYSVKAVWDEWQDEGPEAQRHLSSITINDERWVMDGNGVLVSDKTGVTLENAAIGEWGDGDFMYSKRWLMRLGDAEEETARNILEAMEDYECYDHLFEKELP